jgi:hypothetical protein
MFQPGPAGGTRVGGSINMVGGPNQWLQLPMMNNGQENAMTSGWGNAERGRIWFNVSSNKARVWDGTTAIDL